VTLYNLDLNALQMAKSGFEMLGREFLELFEFTQSNHHHFKITRLNVPMMTVICDTGTSIDMKEVYGRCEEDGTLFHVHTTSIAEGRTLILKQAESPVSLQVFAGGRLQLAGCTSHIDALLMVELFVDMMGIDKTLAPTMAYHVKLLNMTCTISNTQLRIADAGFLRDINDALARIRPLDHNHHAEKREHYSACVLYMTPLGGDYRLSCRLFSSGCMSITGRSPANILYVLRFVLDFFHAHPAHTYAPNQHDNMLSNRRDFRSFQSLLHLFNAANKHVIVHNHLPVRYLVEDCPYCKSHGNVYACDQDVI
jgi:hypothetical protein